MKRSVFVLISLLLVFTLMFSTVAVSASASFVNAEESSTEVGAVSAKGRDNEEQPTQEAVNVSPIQKVLDWFRQVGAWFVKVWHKVQCAFTGHVWQTTTVPATCTVAGSEDKVCSRCGKTSHVDIPVIPHTPKEVVTVATCDTDGKIETVCSVCGTVLSVQINEKHGHTPVETTVPATCEEDGYIQTTCSVCNEVLSTQVIEKLGHVPDTRIIPATCGEDGYTATRCTRCEKVLETGIIPKTGLHDLETQTEPATCQQEGWTKEVCKTCGHVESETVIPKAEHEWEVHNSFIVGLVGKVCKNCHYTFRNEYNGGVSSGGAGYLLPYDKDEAKQKALDLINVERQKNADSETYLDPEDRTKPIQFDQNAQKIADDMIKDITSQNLTSDGIFPLIAPYPEMLYYVDENWNRVEWNSPDAKYGVSVHQYYGMSLESFVKTMREDSRFSSVFASGYTMLGFSYVDGFSSANVLYCVVVVSPYVVHI